MARKKSTMSNQSTGLIEYLDNGELDSSLNLTDNGILSFHWSNWKDSRSYLQDLLSDDSSLERLDKLSHELEDLKSKTIWLKNKHKCVKSTLYNLYQNYLDPRIRMTWFDRNDEILVSTLTESGPYIALTSMRWIDKDIYTSFVRRKMLLDFVPRRDFRVSMNIPVEINYDDSPLTQSQVTIHQITKTGIIMKFHSSSDIVKALNSKMMNMYINLKPLMKTNGSEYKEIIKSLNKINEQDLKNFSNEFIVLSDVLQKFGNKDNIKNCDGRIFYIYIPYSEFISGDKKAKMQQCFVNILEQVQGQFAKELEEMSIPPVKAA